MSSSFLNFAIFIILLNIPLLFFLVAISNNVSLATLSLVFSLHIKIK